MRACVCARVCVHVCVCVCVCVCVARPSPWVIKQYKESFRPAGPTTALEYQISQQRSLGERCRVCVRKRERKCDCVCVCVCVRERETDSGLVFPVVTVVRQLLLLKVGGRLRNSSGHRWTNF